MGKVLFSALVLANLSACILPAFADCRSENVACTKGASSPFDAVACGSLYRTCAAHTIAVQQQLTQTQNASKAGLKSVPGPLATPSQGTLRKTK